jgi:hypothetical protein
MHACVFQVVPSASFSTKTTMDLSSLTTGLTFRALYSIPLDLKTRIIFGEVYKSRSPSTVTRIRKIDKCIKLLILGNIKLQYLQYLQYLCTYSTYSSYISCIKTDFNVRFGDDN